MNFVFLEYQKKIDRIGGLRNNKKVKSVYEKEIVEKKKSAVLSMKIFVPVFSKENIDD